jgi:hypothetical protein
MQKIITNSLQKRLKILCWTHQKVFENWPSKYSTGTFHWYWKGFIELKYTSHINKAHSKTRLNQSNRAIYLTYKGNNILWKSVIILSSNIQTVYLNLWPIQQLKKNQWRDPRSWNEWPQKRLEVEYAQNRIGISITHTKFTNPKGIQIVLGAVNKILCTAEELKWIQLDYYSIVNLTVQGKD